MAKDRGQTGPPPTHDPRRIVTVMRRPGMKLFEVSFKADLRRTPILKLFELLERRGLMILSATMTNTGGEVADWCAFLECEDDGLTPQGLRHLLEEADFGDLRVSGGEDLIVDELHFPIVTSIGERTMLLTQDAFQRMIGAAGEAFGSGGRVISYQEGVALGSRAVGEFQALVGTQDLRRFISRAVMLYGAMGIGRADFVEADFEACRFAVRIFNNIECEGKRTEGPNSEWVRGHLCGAASTALQVPMTCTETKCVAKGDPYCLFELSKQDG